MKTTLSLLSLLLIFNVTIAQTTAIPDANFEQALITLGLDASLDGVVLTANIDTVTGLDVQQKNISDLTGIEDFTALIYFECNNNQITSLDVSQNTSLIVLNCFDNLLTSLNVTQNNNLAILQCNDNQLVCLNMKNGNNTSIGSFYAVNNPNLVCIEVDDVAFSTSNWTVIDPQTSFSTNCPNPCICNISANYISVGNGNGNYSFTNTSTGNYNQSH